MQIKKNITIEFSESDVQEIIADYLNKQGYNVKANDVELDVGSKWTGYGTDERKVYYFEAARVKYKEK